VTAPDFSEPIVGYRAWHAGGGALVPWSAGRAGAWTPGVNQARCLHVGMHPRQSPPVASCSCGLYALADPRDARLRPAEEAVGAVVAWGDVEVHATGFRAQYAAVVALALPDACDPDHEADLRAAAARYGVPLVAPDHLAAAALEYGRPIAFDSILVPQRRGLTILREPVPALGEEGASGIAVDEHLVVTIASGGVRLEPTPPLARLAGRFAPPPPGTTLAAGDVLAQAGGFTLRAPVAGVVGAAPNVWLAPARWAEEAGAIAWGSAAERFYAAHLADAHRRGADPFAALRTHWIHAHARIRSAVDVLDALREQRSRPRFASRRELDALLGEALEIALADEAVSRALARLPSRVVWRLHAPEADIALGDGEDVVLHASAETADDWLAGRLDLARAIRRREVQTSAPLASVLRAASVLKPLHARYAEASSRASSFAS
jgi:hypothetical protein